VPEFLHVGSYLVKEHRSVFFSLNFASFSRKNGQKNAVVFAQNRNKTETKEND